MAELLTQFHFLRPLWLLAIVPALLLAWLLHQQRQSAGNWKNLIAPELMPWLLEGGKGRQPRLGRWCVIAWALACLGLAGPTWQQTPLPVHKQETPLVILFDLSPSMLAQDIKPDRLTRARLKLIDLLKSRKEGSTALVAYAGDAHIVSPLTDDANTIIALASTLSPDIMPVPGSRAEAAMETGLTLAMNAGYLQGDILLVTDGLTSDARETIEKQLRSIGGFKLSILGLGTTEGAPIPLPEGGFAKDSNGGIVIARLNDNELKKLAQRHNGRFTTLTGDDRDIAYLSTGMNDLDDDSTRQLERQFDSWDDQGYWLAIALLPLAILAFRKGMLAALLLTPLFLQSPNANAMDWQGAWDALNWKSLWQRQDQQDMKAFEQGKEAYTEGDFESALDTFSQNVLSQHDSADGYYNQGNALAKSGKLQEALDAYNKALDSEPGMEDAEFNKKLVEQLLQQQQDGQSSDSESSDNENSENQDSDNQSSDNQKQNNQDQSQQKQNQDQQDSNNQQQNSQNSQNSEENSEQQNSQQPSPSDSEAENSQPEKNEQSESQQSQEEKDQQQAANEQKPSEQESDSESNAEQNASPLPDESELSDEQQQALEQWLRRVPDDPGGLMRRKFLYESRRRALEQRRGYNSPPDQNQEERW